MGAVQMKAMVHTEYGEPTEVLAPAVTDRPVPEKGEVLIRVHAAGVNWADWALVRGVPLMVRLGYGLRRPRRTIRGSDVAGVVEQAGEGVEHLAVGDEVFGWCEGAFAEYACAPEGNLVPKPAGITFAQAAAVPMAGMVALQALRDVGEVRAGQRVLVNGASGGIGTFAVQVAKAFGAEVTGVCSTDNVELVRAVGADHVHDYTKVDFTLEDERYDCILDIADNRSLAARRRVLTAHGTLIPNSGEGGRLAGSLGRIVAARVVSLFVRQRLHPFLSMPKRADLVTLAELIDAGDVTPVVGRTFTLAEAGDALDHVGRRHAHGKTVLTI
jgi:NADPH:quinone reductase-like Zn-dependent oxidoreductase